MKPSLSALLLATAIAPNMAPAQSCDAQLSQLTASYSTQSVPTLMAALKDVKAADCAQATEQKAMAQTSAVLAQWAQDYVAAGDLDQAEQILGNAPTLHWAVQAIRGDIAAKRGARQDAAQMYNAALDTISDPSLTPPNPALGPIADRLARLAQENMMLSGSLSSSVTRGGQASGVLKSAMRGIRIEQAGTAPAPASDPSAESVTIYYRPVFLPIRFAFGSDQLDPEGLREAQALARFVLTNKISQFSLVGHTDEIGSEAANLDLSLRRAQSVKAFLETNGVAAKISVDGRGESQPPDLVDSTVYTDEERRQIARRVELVLYE